MTYSTAQTIQNIKNSKNRAINKSNSLYNNNNLTQDLTNWLDAGGYEDFGSMYGHFKGESKYNEGAAAQDILNDFASYTGQQLKNSIYKHGDPARYSTNWGNNQQILDLKNSYLNDQYTNTLDQLDRALKRGTLNQKGYDTAYNKLNKQKLGAQSTMNTAVQGLINSYDQELGNLMNDYVSKADNYDLSLYDTYTANNFNKDFNNKYNELFQGIEGDFYNQMADTPLFDAAGLLGDAKVAQGVTNTQSNDLLGAIEENEQKKNKKVGLGNQGLF